MQMNLFNSANYSEDLARRAKPILQSSEKLTEDMIPKGVNLLYLIKNLRSLRQILRGKI
ncbi:hypothetical protein JTS98_03380 [Clostridium botulinum]|nr:hypothetical protein [Clostridium botulinum]